MTEERGPKETERKNIVNVIMDDLRRGDFQRTLAGDWEDLKELLLVEEQRQKIRASGRLKGAFRLAYYLLKGLLFKLPPSRRLLLLLSFGLLALAARAAGQHNSLDAPNLVFFAVVILVFIMMLELKDKVLAKDELKEGRAIQLSLLPDSCPVDDEWDIFLFTRPANDVGGDMVDCLEIEDSHVCISMADVSGKGLGAALIMAKIQATIRAIAPDAPSLSALAEKLNKILCRDTPQKSFSSLVLISLGKSGEIKYVNAGHMLPVLSNKSSITELPAKSPALGLHPSLDFVEGQALINLEDKLIIYSDGVTELRDENRKFLEKDRFFDMLRQVPHGLTAKEFGLKVIQMLEKYQAGARQHDDLSIIVIDRKK